LDQKDKKVFASEIIECKYLSDYYQGILATVNSNLIVWFYNLFSDMRHISKGMINLFPIPLSLDNTQLNEIANRLMISFEENVKVRSSNSKEIREKYYQPRISKPIIDEIDNTLAEHYYFTEEELDFIINYDIKYRMGKELENEEEDEKLNSIC